MKKVVLGLLVLISLCANAQKSGKDYIMNIYTEWAVECEIVDITKDKVYYKIGNDTTIKNMRRSSVKDFYISNKEKKCKLLPDKCNDKDPQLYRKDDEIHISSIKNIDSISNEKELITIEDETLLTYNIPLNKLDSIDIDLKYTKFCLSKYRNEAFTGIDLGLIGMTVGVLGIFTKDTDIMTACSFSGGLLALIGSVVVIDSFKWLKHSGNKPLLEHYGNGVCIRF